VVLLHVQELASHGEPRGGLTLVHDAGGHGGRYLDAARALAAARWAVALPDLRGHGKSEGERGHSAGIREVLRDLDAVQDHLAYRLPIAPKVLLGHGLGALYAARYALERPGSVAALVLVAPRWRPSFEPPRPAGGIARWFKKPEPTAPGRIGDRAEALFADEGAQRAWREDGLVHDVITLRAAAQAAELAAECERRLEELDAPALLVHGADDPIADPEISRGLAGGPVEARIVDGARHDPLHERGAEAALAAIRDWLDEHA
jgi:alpha-beta hydrolase superfamily lysophospholipase